MKIFRILLVILILVGLQVKIVKADPDSPQGQTSLYFPVVFGQPGVGWIGPDGGSVLGLVVDPFNENIVYAGTFGAGMFKSTDGGMNWYPISNGLPNPKIQSLAIDPVNSNILYAGTYRDERGTHFEGVYKSTDAGQSWFMSSTGLQASVIVYSIAVNPQNSNQVYISTRGTRHGNPDHWNGKVYRSDNGGASWNELTGMSDVGGVEDFAYSITINPTYPEQVFAATHEHGDSYSPNYGDSWTNSTSGIPNSKVNARSIVVDPQSGETPSVYLGIFDLTPGVYYSDDSGINWVPRKNGLVDNWVYGLALDPRNPANLFASTFTNGIYKSTDSALSWNQSGLGLNKTWIVTLGGAASQSAFAGTFGAGVYKSPDYGSTWGHTSAGLRNAWITAVASVPGSYTERFASLNGGGVVHSTDGGLTWTEFNDGLPDLYINNLVVNPAGTMLYALTDTHGLFRFSLAGGSWSQTTPALPNSIEQTPLYPEGHPLADQEQLETAIQNNGDAALSPEAPAPSTIPLIELEIAPSDANIMYLGTQTSSNCGSTCGVYRSSDGGNNWSYRNLSGMTIFNLAVSPSNSNQVYAATSTAGVLKFSSDGGSTWNDIPLAGRTIYSLLIPSTEPGIVYAGTDNGLYAWNGSGWTQKGLSGSSISSLSSVPGAAGKLIAGTSNGAFISLDSGNTWNPGPSELNWLSISSI